VKEDAVWNKRLLDVSGCARKAAAEGSGEGSQRTAIPGSRKKGGEKFPRISTITAEVGKEQASQRRAKGAYLTSGEKKAKKKCR